MKSNNVSKKVEKLLAGMLYSIILMTTMEQRISR